MRKSSFFLGRTGDIVLRLLFAFTGTFFLFVLFAMLHSFVGHKLTDAVENKEKKATTAEMIRREPPKKKEAVRQMREVKSSGAGDQNAARSAPAFRFSPDLSTADGGGDGAVLESGSVQAEVFEEGETDDPAVLLSATPVEYPDRLRELGIEGVFEAILVVDGTGTVSQIEVIRSPHPMIEKGARKVISRWKFKPARNKGVPVSIKMRQIIDFNLSR